MSGPLCARVPAVRVGRDVDEFFIIIIIIILSPRAAAADECNNHTPGGAKCHTGPCARSYSRAHQPFCMSWTAVNTPAITILLLTKQKEEIVRVDRGTTEYVREKRSQVLSSRSHRNCLDVPHRKRDPLRRDYITFSEYSSRNTIRRS